MGGEEFVKTKISIVVLVYKVKFQYLIFKNIFEKI